VTDLRTMPVGAMSLDLPTALPRMRKSDAGIAPEPFAHHEPDQ
jgi:hypothetical protein